MKHHVLGAPERTIELLDFIQAPPARVLLLGPIFARRGGLARRIAGALPEPENLDSTWIHVAAGLHDPELGRMTKAPFRSPHHSCSPAALVGPSHAGEVALSHDGLLLLSEVVEFGSHALSAVASALQKGHTMSGVPTAPQCVVATALLCPCGRRPGPRCTCSGHATERYVHRVLAAAASLGIRDMLTLEPHEFRLATSYA